MDQTSSLEGRASYQQWSFDVNITGKERREMIIIIQLFLLLQFSLSEVISECNNDDGDDGNNNNINGPLFN